MAIQKHLRRYAESWMEANFRIEHWSLRERLETDINRQRIRMFQASPGPLLMKVEGKTIPVEPLDQKPFVTPSWDFLDLTIGPEEFDENHELEGRKRAARLFFEFITGPFWNGLKVCERCGRFFINTKGHQNKVFCSRYCSKTKTALTSTKQQREENYSEKLEKVKEAISELAQLPDAERQRSHWKAWVAKKTGIDQRFITQAITRRKLTEPPWLSSEQT